MPKLINKIYKIRKLHMDVLRFLERCDVHFLPPKVRQKYTYIINEVMRGRSPILKICCVIQILIDLKLLGLFEIHKSIWLFTYTFDIFSHLPSKIDNITYA